MKQCIAWMCLLFFEEPLAQCDVKEAPSDNPVPYFLLRDGPQKGLNQNRSVASQLGPLISPCEQLNKAQTVPSENILLEGSPSAWICEPPHGVQLREKNGMSRLLKGPQQMTQGPPVMLFTQNPDDPLFQNRLPLLPQNLAFPTPSLYPWYRF